MEIGDSVNVNATLVPADAGELDYVSSDVSVVSVNGIGELVAVGGGVANITIKYAGNEMYAASNATITVTVSKIATKISASAVSTVYNVNKNLIVTLKDANGKAMSGVNVTVNLNGAKKYTTDKNGQVKVSTKGLVPKTYTAKVTFSGDSIYAGSFKNVKVTVKKATPKLTAKNKKFKKSTKVKKYSVVLKDNNGKAIKKATVSIKVGKKTFKAKINSKGKATFKLKKLTKKAKYNAKVTYKGNKYYNKKTKKVKITIK